MEKTLIIFSILLFTAFFGCAVNAQDTNNSNKIETKVEKQEYDENVVIKKKPRVGTARFCSQTSGTARLRVTFDKSEKVTDIIIISPSGCNNFDKNAVRAAKKIKFKPAIKNGEPITITKLVEYTFTLYINDEKFL